MERGAKPAKAKIETKPRAATKSRKTDRSAGRQFEQRLAEALEQQEATSKILRVIRESPTDVKPVFDTIAAAALKLCRASSCNVFTVDGELIRLAAIVVSNPETAEVVRREYPRPLGRDIAASRAVLTRTIVAIPDVLDDPEFGLRDTALAAGFRSIVAVPLLRDDGPIGAIAVGGPEPGPFPDKQIALLQTFADQAVIAIENVRLFNETREALEQQTATAEILKVISSSRTDVQPVFEAIVQRAATLAEAKFSYVTTFDGEWIHLRATYGPGTEEHHAFYPIRPGSGAVSARVTRDRAPVQIPDVLTDAAYAQKDAARMQGFRSAVGVPMLRDGKVIGAIAVARPDPGFVPDTLVRLLQTFADQAVIAIENVRLFTELEARNRDLSEALEHQTATGEILRVISISPTDVQPVFEIISSRAGKLCDAEISVVTRVDGEQIHLAAIHGVTEEARETIRSLHPMPLSIKTVTARAIQGRGVVHISDVMDDPRYGRKDAATVAGWRGCLAVPMLREGQVIGAIFVARRNPGLFADSKIELLKTFADQAVIAIENVRLFKETKEALEQQTATSEILRVISRSPTDVQPVFDFISNAALKLCSASSALVTTYDGELVRLSAMANVTSEGAQFVKRSFPIAPSKASASARAVLTRSVVAIDDVLADPEYLVKDNAVGAGFRSVVAVPLMRDNSPIGAITVGRPQVGAIPDKQIALLQTFADQAVIAIENVRLFNETKEALEQQTATSEILRVISQSLTDVKAAFDTIARAALKLCRANSATLFTFDGELIRLATFANVNPEGADAVRLTFPRPPSRDTASTRAVLTGCVVAIPDVLEDPEYAVKDSSVAAGFRSVLSVPLIRDKSPIGAITVGKPEAGLFPDEQVALLQTFANQAVIAIENVRLFKELDARTGELTRSVGELKALGEVGQAVSSTLDLDTVLSTIVSRATQLAGMDGGSIWEYDEASEEFYLHATDRLADELVEALRSAPIRKGEGALGLLAMTGEPVEIRDIVDEASYQSRVRKILIRCGYRSVLAVPLLREAHLLGALAVNRSSPGEFAPEVIDLLKTFATQSALAIQNARLFREIRIKSRQLEVASQHKSEFLANMSHELRTPLNAILGFSEVLAARMFGEINEKQAEYLGDILESGQHLLALINDILDLSKIEAGRMELEPTDFDLRAVIQNALILFRERALRHGITLGCTVDERLGMIRADERKVKQVLLNLLSNALKFTPDDGTVDVRADVNDGEARILVRDTGVGIAPEDQKAVFEEFRQVGTASKKVEGTGLGLTISRKFIELHGGRIWVESQVGLGSTFAFTLPLTIKQFRKDLPAQATAHRPP